MAAETSTAKSLKPVGDTLVEFFKLPMDIVKDLLPEVQQQIQEMPEVFKANRDYTLKQLRDFPKEFQEGISGNMRDNNPFMLLAKAASPVPFLTPDEMAQKQKEQANTLAQSQAVNVKSKEIAESTEKASAEAQKKVKATVKTLLPEIK